jgi:hypothetical protein
VSRLRSERGVSVIELAIVLPLLTLLAFAVAEVGLAWTGENRVQSAVSTATRTGASNGQLVTSDRVVLLSLQAALPPDDLAGLDRVVIYRADSADGRVPEGCLRPFGSPVNSPTTAGLPCNSYSGARVRALNSSNGDAQGFSSGTSCASDRIDRFWCPLSRRDTLSGPPDWIGVYVRLTHENPIPFFFEDFTFEKTAVYRIQPDYAG